MTRDRSAQRGADIILRGFQEFHEGFRAITCRAVERFENRDWDGIRRDTVKRLGLHARLVDETLQALRQELGAAIDERAGWAALKDAYALAILGSDDFELAQTFFNSLTRRVFAHVGIDPAIDFMSQDFPLPYKGWEMASTRMYATRRVSPEVLRRVLLDAPFRVPYQNLSLAAEGAAQRIREAVREKLGREEIEALDFLRPLFIRNKAAYLVGRARAGDEIVPLLLAILNPEGGLVLDAVVSSEGEISIVFSFARWYFHADLASPRQVIGFLRTLLPRKRISELYLSLGYNKHGKTEFYSDLTSYIAATDERFVVAPGQPGLVMSVFTLPSYEFVFKVIKDHFPPPKRTTRRQVIERYRQVLLQDRVGRLVDFQEFEHLKFPRARFSDEILRELLDVAAKTVMLEGDDVVIRHVYAGRRVTPLDLFLAEAPAAQRREAVIEWGNAIKEMAAANIFAGDMLLKNFGVTRHGRVVFYDYDELCLLSECRFRAIPESRDPDQELSPEPWFSVRDGDVFPEELERFLGLDQELRELFITHHGDLFQPAFWQRLQERHREGEVIDFFPYAESLRLGNGAGATGMGASSSRPPTSRTAGR